MTNPHLFGSNINLVKMHNLRAVLLTLLHEGSLSRVQIARRTSLSNTTITNLISELLEAGIVVEEGQPGAARQRKVGRPRTLLRLVPDARFVVGIHIGIGMLRVAVANLYAEIVHHNLQRFDVSLPPEAVVEKLVDLVCLTLHESGVEYSRVLGVGAGASGLVDHRQGINLLAPNLGWHDVPLKQMLQERLNLPVVVDNNVRVMALGEALYGAGRGVNVLAFVYGRVGVGAGFVVDGQIFHGSSAGAGEIGHTIILSEGGTLCRCGNTGCLETLISETAIIAQAGQLAARDPSGILAKALKRRSSETRIERIFSAAREGDQPTRLMLKEQGHYLGLALANLVNVLNPELIILGGIFAQAEDLLLPAVEATLRQRAFGRLGETVRLQVTGFGWRAGVTGAAALALAAFFYHQL